MSDNKPNTASLGLTIFAVILLAISAFVLTTPDVSNRISAVLQQGTYSSSTFDPVSAVNTKQFATVEEFTDFVKSNEGDGGYYGVGTLSRNSVVAVEAMTDEVLAPTAAPSVDAMQKAVKILILLDLRWIFPKLTSRLRELTKPTS